MVTLGLYDTDLSLIHEIEPIANRAVIFTHFQHFISWIP